jgi:hypothetical protein
METEIIESKKCNNCLRRLIIEQVRCPFCGKDDFTYDGAFIERAIKRKFNLFKSISGVFKKSKND